VPERFGVEVVATPLPSIVAEGYFMLAERLSRLVEPARLAAGVLSREIATNFAVGGRPTPWPPLADVTVRRKGHDRLLVDTEDMYSAATSEESWQVESGGRSASAHLDSSALPYYSIFHIEGTQFMPERDFTFIPDEALDKVEDIFGEFIDQALEAVP
jgi:hypothetical protein